MTPRGKVLALWTSAFALLGAIFALRSYAGSLDIVFYPTFLTLVVMASIVAFAAVLKSSSTRLGAVVSLSFLSLMGVYLLSLRHLYSGEAPVYGLDTYFSFAATRVIQVSGIQFGLSPPPALAGILEFPLPRLLLIDVMAASGLPLFASTNFLVLYLSGLACFLFFATVGRLAEDFRARFLLTLGFLVTYLLLIMDYGGQLVGLALMLGFLFLLFSLFERGRAGGWRFSALLIVVSIALISAHQVTPFVLLIYLSTLFAGARLSRSAQARPESPESRNSRSPNRAGRLLLLFGVLLVAYWMLVTLSIPAWLSKVQYVLSNPTSLQSGGFHLPLNVRVGLVLLAGILGILGLYVLRNERSRITNQTRTYRAALVWTSGALLVFSFTLGTVGIPLDVIRFLFFIQILVLIAASPDIRLEARKAKVAFTVVIALVIVSNLLIVPASVIDPNLPPNFRDGEFRTYVTPSQSAAVKWLPSGSVAVGDHYFFMASLLDGEIHVVFDQQLVAEPQSVVGQFRWYLYDDYYQYRIVDRNNGTYATLNGSELSILTDSPPFSKVYNNGEATVFMLAPAW